jgi:hypothetical protein
VTYNQHRDGRDHSDVYDAECCFNNFGWPHRKKKGPASQAVAYRQLNATTSESLQEGYYTMEAQRTRTVAYEAIASLLIWDKVYNIYGGNRFKALSSRETHERAVEAQ